MKNAFREYRGDVSDSENDLTLEELAEELLLDKSFFEEVEKLIDRFGSNNLILRSQSSSSRGVSMGANSVNTLTLSDMENLKKEYKD